MDTEITVIGAGVVGLAIGEKLTEIFRDVFIIEKHPSFGQETSSRNSEVIHAGIYYPEGSLKAKLCVEGKSLLYDYCSRFEIPFKNCGKLIVATSQEEISQIESIRLTAMKNGVELEIIDRSVIEEMEPAVFALKALYSPATGIVDTHSLMKRFETNIINNGGQIVYGSEVTGIKKIEGGYEVTVFEADKAHYNFTTKRLLNSAGLDSDRISVMAGVADKELTLHFCKGEYFRVRPPKNKLISRLVYPVPFHNLEGVGIHATVELNGGLKLGPDVTYTDPGTYNYKVTPSKQDYFWRSARKYLPSLEYDDLIPEMAGIRPKLQGPGGPVKDFYIKEESDRGLKGFVNLIGIESPGLTSCISIANYVVNLIRN
jgi:L-2-hydroxyglutarate oxidase LhgO